MRFPRKSSGSMDKSEKSWSTLEHRLKKERNSDIDDFVVIGIDFGTTYVRCSQAGS